MNVCKKSINIFFIIYSFIIVGCSTYKKEEIRIIEHDPIHIGIVENNFINYFPIRISHFPDKESNELIVHVEKKVCEVHRYVKKIHKEQIFRLKGNALDRAKHKISKGFERNFISGLIELILSPLRIFIDKPKPFEQEKSELIPESDKIVSEYDVNIEKNVSGSNVTVSLEGYGERKTDRNGFVKFYPDPVLFDDGLKLFNHTTNKSYLIKRMLVKEEYRADWYDCVNDLSTVIGSAVLVIKVAKVAIMGGGVTALAAVIIREAASSIIVGYVIEILSQKTRTSYRWAVVRI